MLRKTIPKRLCAVIMAAAAALVVLIYVFAVQLPVCARLSEIEAETGELLERRELAAETAAECERMKSEIEAAKSSSEVSPLPDYDNLPEIMLGFSEIFGGELPDLRSEGIKQDGGVGKRVISFRFEAESFADARKTLAGMNGLGFRSEIENLSLGSDSDLRSGRLTVSGSIAFYELNGGAK